MKRRNYEIIRRMQRLRSSFWFVPIVMILFALVAAAATILLDTTTLTRHGFVADWIRNIGSSGARSIFTTIAGSTITVAGVIFSIAMVVISMASSQFGPRLISTFMRVGRIQLGIGLFVGTFVYCLAMLSVVPGTTNEQALPVFGVVFGLGLGIVAFIVLIMLIHEIAMFIQAPNVVDRVNLDIRETFSRVFPEQSPDEQTCPLQSWKDNYRCTEISVTSSGYIRTIDYEGLLALCSEKDFFIHTVVKPGHYLIENQKIAFLYSHDEYSEDLGKAINNEFNMGPDRDLAQDAEYAIEQMNEIALRALSPGINDPFTAINCIDKLSGALGYLASRAIDSAQIRDAEDTIRIVTTPNSFSSIVNSAYDQIRQNSENHVAVKIRLIESLSRLGRRTLPSQMREALQSQLLKIEETSRDHYRCKLDEDDMKSCLESARKSLYQISE